MAEPTEQEQIKQTQVLEKVAKSASDTTGKLDKVIAGLINEGEEKDILKEIKEQGEDKVKADKVSATEDIKFHDKQEKFQKEKTTKDEKAAKKDEQSLDTLTDFKEESSEADKKQQTQNQFVKDQEKKKEALAKMSFSFTQRAAKLATRAGKGALDWGRDKVKTVTRAVGGFFENLLKLLALLGLWFALSWLKGKDLKKMFDDFMKKVNQIIDEWIPQWIKDLSGLQLLGLGIATLVGGWLLLKGAIATAGWALRRTGARMTESLGTKSALSKQLIRMQAKLDKLVAERNAIKRTRKLATSLEAKSVLDKQLERTNKKIAELETNINKKTSTMHTAESFADKLKEKSVVDKQLKKANKALKLATAKSSAIAESVKWSKNLDMNSKVGKQLMEANVQLEKTIAEQRAAEQAVRKNIAERNAIKAGKEIHIMKEGQWIDKKGVIHEGGKPVGGEGTGKTVKGAPTLDIKEKGVSVGERISGWWERTKAHVSGGIDKMGEAKVGGQKLKNIGKAGGWLADVGWRLTKILEPFRGAIAGRREAQERGEGFWGQVEGITAGAMHGTSDLAASVVGFMGQIGKLAEEGGIRGIGMLSGDSEAVRDATVKRAQEHEWNLFHKAMNFLQDTDETWQKGNNALFGQWRKGTKMHELMESKMGTEKGFSLMDMVGLGDKGGWEGVDNFWTSYFELRQEDIGKVNEANAKATIKQREKWKKEGSVDMFGYGKKPVPKEELLGTVLEKNVVDPLIVALKEFMQQTAENQALIAASLAGGGSTYNVAGTTYLGNNQATEPNKEYLKE
jgi:hypothetical protein